MLLGNGQRGRVDPLVDHLPLPRLEREQTLSCVTHPAPGTHTHTDRERYTHFDHVHFWIADLQMCMVECALTARDADIIAP